MCIAKTTRYVYDRKLEFIQRELDRLEAIQKSIEEEQPQEVKDFDKDFLKGYKKLVDSTLGSLVTIIKQRRTLLHDEAWAIRIMRGTHEEAETWG